ncbi:KaiA family protein [Anabaena cylindrica FACHB-243]|uniref:Circadian clock oscillator protein KaiA n=1 Tax=Anabaena cylindrica (strain ATCC 27899 / PCC 7122) TaxID=272123 RepID=K9ZKA6_ANACC|nr:MULTISPECIES: KaiA family protein [Anabaena]AFZ58745.1 KaiA family protein [Anabaena cylindrica PCC 7122]MBD2420087.1 KaiA family protein [Anabaena cylindrica FACHB-243]MBY5282942.1 KaiA family protein [Anabaena sp. CCAP 1446/1C]MBY5306559.1 KaiA family protein [Anabaena sp. CCAP 1446/1C]MCM2407016.1 circadian clock protein KaiA [Anabaena sp. CCAP 1446/1C]
MILPILLIWRSDVKKYLDNYDPLYSHQSLIEQLWNFLESIITQLFAWPLAVITPVKISSLQKIRQLNINAQLAHSQKYSYVLACNQQWFQEMSPAEKQEILEKLKSDYRVILINYFTTDKNLKIIIDKFINALFYANIPVPRIIEMHMELIDEFSKQLRLEGRSDETLLDYRLTLIDILANLCEAYRCSVSKMN